MKNLIAGVKRFIKDEQGVTAIEYALIAALIAIVIITAAALVGTRLDCIFDKVASCLKGATEAGCTAVCA